MSSENKEQQGNDGDDDHHHEGQDEGNGSSISDINTSASTSSSYSSSSSISHSCNEKKRSQVCLERQRQFRNSSQPSTSSTTNSSQSITTLSSTTSFTSTSSTTCSTCTTCTSYAGKHTIQEQAIKNVNAKEAETANTTNNENVNVNEVEPTKNTTNNENINVNHVEATTNTTNNENVNVKKLESLWISVSKVKNDNVASTSKNCDTKHNVMNKSLNVETIILQAKAKTEEAKREKPKQKKDLKRLRSNSSRSASVSTVRPTKITSHFPIQKRSSSVENKTATSLKKAKVDRKWDFEPFKPHKCMAVFGKVACNSDFESATELVNHIKKFHAEVNFTCQACGFASTSTAAVKKHRESYCLEN